MAVIVFAGDGDEIYAKVGLLSAVSLVAALAASYSFGKLIDRRKGGVLLKFSTIFNSFIHLMRAFISTPTSVVLANIMNEAGTTGYSMAFTRGLFDAADSSGKRLAYLYIIEIMVNFGASFAALILAAIFALYSGELGLRVFFVVTAGLTLLIMTPRFMLYRR
ncbi:TPA: hypothetical protein DHU97_00825 [Candidatus Saccharibacteria bacterium]|nr:hypothetical protein [Candidatus Saccharibacteria bacterium]